MVKSWCIPIAVLLMAFCLGGGEALAKKGGGKPGGGGEPPASDPRLVYDWVENGQWFIGTANADGSGASLVLAVDATYGPTPPTPSWSPDRSEIVFRALDADGFALFIVDADGSNLRKIVPGTWAGLFDPTWSPMPAPDGEHKIAFSASPDGTHGQIFVCNTDGTELVNLTADLTRSDNAPAWSPDATAIAAGTSTTTVLPRDIVIYTLTAANGSVVTSGSWDATDGTILEGARINGLDWSPGGDELVMSVDDELDSLHDDLWVLNLDTGAATNISQTTGNDERDPAWSPDGTRVLFRYQGYRKEGKNSGLYTVRTDGSDRTSLDLSEATHPDWR